MGSHDPEDGYVIFVHLLMTFQSLLNEGHGDDGDKIHLGKNINIMKSMINISPTTDPLG